MQGFDEGRFAAVLEGFTEEAREAVARAQEEAARLGHGQANTGHLLLGLLRDGVAARALAALNITPDEAREVVENVGGRGEEGTTLDRGPFTPRLARVVELAPREAARAGQDRVGGGHLLLGLVREANSVGVRVLSVLGASPADVRREVFGRLRNPSRQEPREPSSRAGSQEGPASLAPDQTDEETAASEEAPPMTVRGRVEGLEVHVRCGISKEERALPQALLVDLQYVYDAQFSDGLSSVVDYGALLVEAARALEREEFMLLETGARRIGARVLERFPPVREVAVTVTKPRVPVARTVSGVSVRAVFRR
jgi:dihydroneopterin aldolase